MTDSLVEYIRDALAKGYQELEIRNLLRAQGWQESDLDRSFALVRRYTAAAVQTAPPATARGYAPAALSTISDLFSHAFNLYASRFWTLLGIQLLQLLMLVPMFLILIAGAFVAGFSGIGRNGVDFAAMGAVLVVVIPVFLVVAIVAGSWTLAATLFAVKDSQEGIGAIEAYRRGWGRIGSTVLALILQGLCVLAGLLLLLVPGILFAVWFSLSTIAVVAEGCSGGAALGRSKALVDGYWWDLFARYVLLFIAIVGVYILPVGMLAAMEAMAEGPVALMVGGVRVLVEMALNAAVTPFAQVFLYLIYFNLRKIKG
ncbi:MAG: hypothetical protein AB1714_28995 [Acidobacteriota bacterium]